MEYFSHTFLLNAFIKSPDRKIPLELCDFAEMSVVHITVLSYVAEIFAFLLQIQHMNSNVTTLYALKNSPIYYRVLHI